jgi:imidazolonepropionase-like amidohydrolase
LFSVADTPALDRAWPLLLASRPDFVKAYLLYSEEYAARLADPETVGWRGLDPVLLPEIVRRARAAGSRVAVHVESAADFHVAVAAGVDQVAHLPGFRGNADAALPDPAPYRIRDADAQLAARKGIVVVTTVSGLARYADGRGDGALRRAADELNAENLATLRRHRVAVAIGSDEYGETSVQEALYLQELGVFDPAELLRIWTETTARTIFPTRRLGRLEPGYEASFLSLAGDPLSDFANVTRIRLRVKQGQVLDGY